MDKPKIGMTIHRVRDGREGIITKVIRARFYRDIWIIWIDNRDICFIKDFTMHLEEGTYRYVV